MAQKDLPSASATSAEGEHSDEAKLETKFLMMDIDAEDQCEYQEDIWKNLLEQSHKPTIHLQSPQLEFRGSLVQLLREARRKMGLSVSTLHAAVAQLDLFMDAHRLRADRLTHVALACLSLAAKSEEKFSQTPILKTLAAISGVTLCGKTFRQLEWMIGQHARWRLLAPTPVTFAALIAHCVVTDADLTSTHPDFVRRFRQDGAKLLEAYLDLTLLDVRLKVVEAVDVGCACVACARADLGLCAWPPSLVALTTRKPATVAPIARLLQRMMKILKSRGDVDQSCSRAPPCESRCASPGQAPPSIGATASCCNEDRERLELREHPVLDLSDRPSAPPAAAAAADGFKLPTAADAALQRANNAADYRYCRSSRLLEESLDAQPSTSAAVKRGLDAPADVDAKRCRLTAQMPQPCPSL